MIKIITAFLIFLFLAGSYRGEAQTMADTLNKAKQLRSKGKMHKAYILLKKCQSHHPDDLNVTWYTAQTAYWAHRTSKSKRLYRKAILANPKNLYLQLDYAKILVNLGEFNRALPLLDTYLKYDPTNAQALTVVAKILFWQSKYKAARAKVRKALLQDPEYTEASGLLRDINLASAPSISLGVGYNTDDQPQQMITPAIGGSLYLHPLSTLHFSFQDPVILQDSKTFMAQNISFGNQMYISRANLAINLDAGLVRFPYKNNINWTGDAELNETFAQHLVLSLKAERSSYFSTLSSVDTVVMQNHFSLSLEWNNNNSWNGKAALDGFTWSSDNNRSYGGYAWIFAPPVRFGGCLLHLGYGYSYSTSDHDHFVAEKSLTEILANYDPSVTLTGIYDPYYTPSEQQINSALLVFNGKIFPWLNCTLNANIGIFARVHAPYLYLDKDKNVPTIFYIAKGFKNTNYHPVSVTLMLLMKVSDRIHLQAEFRHTRTYFFTSNYAGLGLNIRLMNDKKKK